MNAPLRFGSICSGIEAASAAWLPLDWRCAFVAEVDPNPAAVLMARHDATRPLFPLRVQDAHGPEDKERRRKWGERIAKMPEGGALPNFGDMTRFKEWSDAAIDVLVGGTPCQSFSIAGLRRGLDDPRGSLMLGYGAIAARYRPRWLVWENVPGVLSSSEGRDFASLLGLLSGQDITPPIGGWKNSGIVAGDANAYGLAWRVLDAQYFGVPQRRRRVFVVGHLGDWRPAAAVLLERESLSGNPPPRRQAREAVAGTIAGGARRSGGYSADDIPHISHALNAHGGSGRIDAESETFVTVAIQAGATRENPNSGPDGVGVQTDLAYTIEARAEVQAVAFDTTQITSPTNRSQPKAGDPSHPLSATAHAPAIAFTGKDYGAAASEIAPTLRAMGHTNSHANAGGQVAVALNLRGREGGAMPELDDLASLRAASGGSSRSFVQTSTVRRLSPLECERLQGFADGFTRITVRTYRKQPKGAHFEKFRDLYEANPDGTWTRFIDDGPRYRMLGNSMAVPVMSWLGRRIAIVDLELRKAAWKWKP